MNNNGNQVYDIKAIIEQTDMKKRNELYGKYVKAVTPVHSIVKNVWRAFFTGGIICVLGQGFTALFKSFDIVETTAGMYSTLCLITLSALLTGAGLFSKIAKYAGAGVLVPITGFANSVAAPAIEFKKEGQVYGIGCKIFTIAGPVILYGVFVSWFLGVITFLAKMIA